MNSTSTTDNDDSTKLYLYHPSLAAAIVFAALFAITASLHLYQMACHRIWFLLPLTIGAFFEVLGYAARAVNSTQDPDYALGLYIVQILLPLVAPALFAASIYMTLGRIILLLHGERHSIVKRTKLTKIFVLGDVLTFTVQSGGGGLQSSKDPSTVHTGQYIVLGGLILQVVSFGFFVLVAIIFNIRIRKTPTPEALDETVPWQKHLYAIYASSVWIMVRSIFRIIEFVQGRAGYTQSHEWGLYVFDAVLMLGVLILFNMVHPGEVKRPLVRNRQSLDGQVELVEGGRK